MNAGLDMDSYIEMIGLGKRYPGSETDSLSNISLKINEGEKFGILGPNGAGKTTLISIMCGILNASVGSCNYIHNNQTISHKELKSFIGLVPQDFAFYEDLSPMQNLEYFGALYNLSSSEIKSRSKSLLDILGLSKVANQHVKKFSGGMKRRVNLAIGLIHQPAYLFLDEPTVGVDVQSKNAILEFLEEQNNLGTTIIYTSHHLQEAEIFCDRIALIDMGELIHCDYTKNLLRDHQEEDLQSLFIKLTGKEYRD